MIDPIFIGIWGAVYVLYLIVRGLFVYGEGRLDADIYKENRNPHRFQSWKYKVYEFGYRAVVLKEKRIRENQERRDV